MEQILTADAGYLRVIRLLLDQGLRVFETIPFNEGRYHFIRTNKFNLVTCYKREFFNTFGKIFNQGNAKGETLNVEELKQVIQKNAEYIYFTYHNGDIYSIKVQDFLENSFERTIEYENKKTRSVDIKHLKREQ